jgi:hypothetical protein
MASVKLDVVNKLRALHNNLKQQEKQIQEGMDRLENERKQRDIRRKEILLHEVKTVLASLHETDRKLVKDLKSDVFDQLRAMSKVEREVLKLLEAVKVTNNQDMDTMAEVVGEVTRQVDGLDLDNFSR